MRWRAGPHPRRRGSARRRFSSLRSTSGTLLAPSLAAHPPVALNPVASVYAASVRSTNPPLVVNGAGLRTLDSTYKGDLDKSDHFNGTRFVNPTGAAGQPFSALPRLLREPRTPWPARVDVAPRRPSSRDGATAVVTFIGHSTFLIQTAAGNVVTDPMYSERAGPLNVFGPRRVRQPAVPFDELPPISIVLLSHNHYDHCDRPTLRRLADRFDPLVVTPVGNGPLVRSTGIGRVEELDWWQEGRAATVPITLTPAQHFSARGPFDRNRALWGGFTLVIGGARIFFAGDTGYAPFFRDIRRRLGRIDLALLPIGAYEPRWFMGASHMNPEEAVQVYQDLGGTGAFIPSHWGTFRLTFETPLEPPERLRAAWSARGLEPSALHVPRHGETVRLRLG